MRTVVLRRCRDCHRMLSSRGFIGSGDSPVRSRTAGLPFRPSELFPTPDDDGCMFWLALVPPAMTRNAQPPHSQRLVVVEVSSLNRSISGSALLACRRSHYVPSLDMVTKQALGTTRLANRLSNGLSSGHRGCIGTGR